MIFYFLLYHSDDIYCVTRNVKNWFSRAVEKQEYIAVVDVASIAPLINNAQNATAFFGQAPCKVT